MADNGQNGETHTTTPSKPKSEDGRKLFVGGLSWETTSDELKDYFEKYGTVTDCTLKTDPTSGRSRGFGFVLFEEQSSVKAVLAEGTHSLNGRNIDPKLAKAKPGQEPIKKVFVGGLDPSVPEADIREHFAKFGEIEELSLPFDKMKNQRRAFCFITYANEDSVDDLMRSPKQTVAGKEVDVKKATPKEDNQGGYGGRGGRGGFGGGFGGGRGRGRGGYNQGGDWNQGYDSYGGGYDYSQQGYGNYDYSGYDYSGYNNYNQGWGGYDYSGQGGYGGGYGSGGYGGGKQAGGYGQRRGGGQGYHPYSR